jgi:small GTP-binding protein
MPDLAIVVLGSGAVGKSCISIQYIQGHFVERYDSTIEDIYRKPVDIDGEQTTLTIVDTAGQDAFGGMRENFMRTGQAFVLVFSITDSESLQKLKVIYAQLVRVRGEGSNIPCVVVGNKIDLSAQRAVPPEMGKEFARFANCHYFEITARDKGQVEEVFAHLVRVVRRGSSAAVAASASSAGSAASSGVGGAGGGAPGSDTAGSGATSKALSSASAASASPAVTATPQPLKKPWRCFIG